MFKMHQLVLQYIGGKVLLCVCVCVSTRCRREEKARKVTWYLLYVCKYVCCKYVKS